MDGNNSTIPGGTNDAGRVPAPPAAPAPSSGAVPKAAAATPQPAAKKPEAAQAGAKGDKTGQAGEDPAIMALREIVHRAQKGDPSALPELRKALADHPEYFVGAGDLAATAEKVWLNLACGSDLFAREAIERQLATLREELTGPNPTRLEMLTIDRVVICRLQAYHADVLLARAQSRPELPGEEALRRQESAERRFAESVKQLAMIQKLLRPSTKANRSSSTEQTPQTTQSTKPDTPMTSQPSEEAGTPETGVR